MKVTFICRDCGTTAKKNEEKSSEQWEVIDNKPCDKCGGKIVPRLK